MGFYGNIKNTSRTQFTFDKIYPNRREMDNAVNTDGIYAGRYVLVEYDTDFHRDNFTQAILKDGILYSAIDSSDEGLILPYVLEGSSASGIPVKGGQVFVVPGDLNFDESTQADRIYVTRGASETKNNVPAYIYNSSAHALEPAKNADGSNKVFNSVTHISAVLFTAETSEYTGSSAAGTSSYLNYVNNYNLDKEAYGISRGYDSTVWQKTYTGSQAKYVMVAELNSVVPTFDLSADAPSLVPLTPHFDVDSTNVYYKLHWQPAWGFRVKSSLSDLAVPELNTEGEISGGAILTASTDVKDYPSDETTKWTHQVINKKNGTAEELTFVTADPNGNPSWVKQADVRNNADRVPAAIYFNKAGFDPETITYSFDKKYAGWDGSLVKDAITVTPSGRSGHMYNVHGNGLDYKEMAPDTQELSIMLPSIGDTMASIWDLIYGGRNLDADMTTRNTDVSWYDAKAVSQKSGPRMIKCMGPGKYTYNAKAAGTVAGVLNSVQDLMGMIITTYDPSKMDLNSLNDDYIYFVAGDDNTGTYNFKHKYYEYTTKTFANNIIPNNYNPYSPVTVKEWDNKYLYIDTSSKYGKEFVLEDEYHPDRKYLPQSLIQGAMTSVPLSAEYKADGSFFKKLTADYPATTAGSTSGGTYTYYVGTTETYDATSTYYKLTPAKKADQLQDGEAIYVPNTYYYVDYQIVELTNITYEPNVYYYITGYNHAVGSDGKPVDLPQYVLAKGATMADNLDSEGNAVNKYYKRAYILETSLTKRDKVYYRVKVSSGQNSNAYYQLVETAEKINLTAKTYMNSKYYYIVDKATYDSSTASDKTIINNVYYVCDDNVYSDTQFAANNRTYYVINRTYQLVQGKDVININDNNVELVQNMRDMSEFKTVSPDGRSGRSLFYIYVDSARATRYIEVNYNNFSKSYNPQTQNYDLIVMDYSIVGKPYVPNTYYYIVDDKTTGKAGSYLIDNSKKITEGRTYYEFNTAQQSILDQATYLDGYYCPNKYYVESTKGSGDYILCQDKEFDPSKTYYNNTLELYVKEDTAGIYDVGAKWPMEVKKIPSTVTLATRSPKYELKELPGFGDKITTLHGLLLKLYENIDPSDKLTRDNQTSRGTINLINDLMNRFAALAPGELTVVDSYGRMHSANQSTSQTLSYTNRATNASVGSNVTKDNALITLVIDDNYKQPKVTITHSNVTKVADTKDAINLDTASSDNFEIVQPITDNAGHVAGLNRTTVTLPKGFKTIRPAASDSVDALTANTTAIAADNSHDTLTIGSGNKWIQLAGDDTNNKLTIAHSIVSSSFAGTKSNSQDFTPAFGAAFHIPVITVDNAGHVTKYTTENVTLPKWQLTAEKVAATTGTNDVVLSVAYGYNSETDTGTLTATRGKVDTLTIQDYSLENGNSGKLAATDTIHEAFEKLQKQINGMDLATVGGGTGEYITSVGATDGILTVTKSTLPTVTDTAVNGQFVSRVTQTNGRIAVTRATIVPTVNSTAGTSDSAQELSITINGQTSAAQSLTKATTGVYGVTKLTNTFSSTSTDLAVTGAAVNAALDTLDVTGTSGIAPTKTIASWSETNGKVNITTQDIAVTDNIIADGAISMAKINGLSDALGLKANIGTSSDASTVMSLYGLSAKINELSTKITGASTDDGKSEDQITLQGLANRIAALEAIALTMSK